MASDIIIASVILTAGLGASIGGSIWWAQRDRSVAYNGQLLLGEYEDRLERKLDQVIAQTKHKAR